MERPEPAGQEAGADEASRNVRFRPDDSVLQFTMSSGDSDPTGGTTASPAAANRGWGNLVTTFTSAMDFMNPEADAAEDALGEVVSDMVDDVWSFFGGRRSEDTLESDDISVRTAGNTATNVALTSQYSGRE